MGWFGSRKQYFSYRHDMHAHLLPGLDDGKSDIKIIAKIENQEGVDNIDEILDHVYGVIPHSRPSKYSADGPRRSAAPPPTPAPPVRGRACFHLFDEVVLNLCKVMNFFNSCTFS